MRIENFIGVDGERQIMLLHDDGLPDFWATRWVLEVLRQSGQAANTIDAKLRAVQLLYAALPVTADLTPRLAKGEWLTAHEADHLIGQLAKPAADVQPFGHQEVLGQAGKPSRVVSLEKVRSKLKKRHAATVQINTKWNRTKFIREYLRWRMNDHLVTLRGEKKTTLAKAYDEVDGYIEERTAAIDHDPSLEKPVGLTAAQQELLLQVIQPDDTRNPWKNDLFIRLRNQLCVELMLKVGPRRGAVLGLQMRDLDPTTGRVDVMRRKDDPDDTRPRQTGNKRGDYQMTLGYRLLSIFKAYQIQRHKLMRRQKRSSPYLIVSERGDPLEQSSFNKMLEPLRSIPELAGVHPHLLRHTWASNFVAEGVAQGLPFDEIHAALRVLGGWAENSTVVFRYTSMYRHNRAEEMSLAMQKRLVPFKKPNPKEPS